MSPLRTAAVCATLVGVGAVVVLFNTAGPRGAAVAAAAAAQEAAPTEVTTLAQNWSDALSEGRVDWMKPMLAVGYVYVNPRGQALGGDELLRQLKDKTIKFTFEPTARPQVHMHRDAVVATGLCRLAGAIEGRKIDGDYRYVDVFQRKGDRWVAIASTMTRVEDEK